MVEVPGQPAAFMSYVLLDDEHNDRKLTQFRERLSAEVRVQTGRDFPIFQDRNDIAWGENWQVRIDRALDEVTLLLAVMTPSFFLSTACRSEVEHFLQREKELGSQELILPIYYVSVAELDERVRPGDPPLADPLVAELRSRQFADLRELRLEPFTSAPVQKAVALLATRIRDRLSAARAEQAGGGPPRPRVPVRPGGPAGAAGPARSTESGAVPAGGAATQETAKEEPPTHVVDQYQRGDFATIAAAVAAAAPGDRILVRPGRYLESLVVDKPLEIIGDGPLADIELRSRDANALVFKANIGRIANLTVRQVGGGNWYGVDITQGRLQLDGCDVSSQSLACVAIRSGADPRLRGNCIHGGRETGVYVYDDGLGTLEDNEVTDNAGIGVAIKGGADPTLRRNRIHHNRQSGVVAYDGGRGTLEDNDIAENALSGVAIRTAANPTLRHNQIHDNVQCGVFVYNDGVGTLEDNDISANLLAGVEIKTGGRPVLRRNRVNRNGYEAIWVYEGGGGVVEDNDLTGNARGAWDVEADCLPHVSRARNQE